MKNLGFGWLAFGGVLASSYSFAASPAISLDSSQFLAQEWGPAVFGWDFSVRNPVRITALGLYDSHGTFRDGGLTDGFIESHAIGVWRLLQQNTPLLTATVPAGTAASLEGAFRYVPVAPLDLIPGEHYVIGALYSVDGDYMVSDFNSPTSFFQINPAISFGALRSGPGSTLVFPVQDSPDHVGHFGPNFLFEEVPEPTTTAFSIGALASLLLARRRG